MRGANDVLPALGQDGPLYMYFIRSQSVNSNNEYSTSVLGSQGQNISGHVQ